MGMTVRKSDNHGDGQYGCVGVVAAAILVATRNQEKDVAQQCDTAAIWRHSPLAVVAVVREGEVEHLHRTPGRVLLFSQAPEHQLEPLAWSVSPIHNVQQCHPSASDIKSKSKYISVSFSTVA